MLLASIFSHIALGALLSLIFILFYMNGDGKWKLFIEIIIGAGGNIGGIFLLDNWLKPEDPIVRMYSVGCCIISFLVVTFFLLLIFSHIIKDKDDKDIIRLRDIMLGQTSWVNKYYERRAKEIDNKLNISSLKNKAEEIKKRQQKILREEEKLEEKKKFIQEELDKLNQMAGTKLRINLPEHAAVILNKEYVEAMPSYIGNIIMCINDITACTNMILERDKQDIDIIAVRSYFTSLATYISVDLFGGNTPDVRIHFRIYDVKQRGYVKLVAVIGKKILGKDLTLIPYEDDSMIRKSYECRRALIKSINNDHDYQSKNHNIWKDYLTYTFYDIMLDNIPVLSFGISVKNAVRYKKVLHFLNFFRIEDFLQNNIEKIDEYIDLAQIFYGGSKYDSHR